MDNSEKMMSGLIGKITQVITATDSGVQSPDNSDYISWFAPGIPFSKDDLSFAANGLGSGKTGQEARSLLRNAKEVATCLNLIPKVGAITDGASQSKLFSTDSQLIWKVWQNVLDFSEIATGELTAEEKAKLEKFRNLLITTKTVKNLVTDEETTQIVDGPVAALYKEYQGKYFDAFTQYNTMRISALNSDSPNDVQQWAFNSQALRSKLQTAYEDWTTKGYKNDVESMYAYIDQMSRRDLGLYKRNLLDDMRNSRMTDVDSGADFHFTTFSPASFINGSGWTEFKYASTQSDTYAKSVKDSWDVNVKFKFWGAHGETGTSGSVENGINTSDFEGSEISFSLIQVPISRAWFDPTFLLSRAWRFSKITPITSLSKGVGLTDKDDSMPGYPTVAVFVKDVEMKFSSKNTRDEFHKLVLSVEASGGWGPISIGTKYGREEEEKKGMVKTTDQGLKIEGMQLIALKCTSLPKCPNPLPEITNWK